MGTETVNFTITPGAPAAPTAHEATAVTSSLFTANWGSSPGAIGYRLDVSTSSTFSGYVSGYNDLDVGNVLSKKISGLNSGTTYYYRVRAYNDHGTSGNSSTISTVTARLITIISENPSIGAAISVSPADKNGLSDGSTPFTRTYDHGASVTLNAPALVQHDGSRFSFCWWTINEGKQPRLQHNLETSIIDDYTFAARYYMLRGDANGDCKVDILDLIFIRNRLNTSPTTGDNWQADVNGDGKINILDLIFVRNRLGTACPSEPLADMCFVPAGTFTTSTDVEVYLSAYYIDKYEVTNELYCQFLNSGGKDDHWHDITAEPPYEQQIIKHGPGNYSVMPRMERRPVRHVNWYDAVAFCDWRSAAEGLPRGTYHLPTEAQWEKAAGWDHVEQKLWKYGIRSDTITTQQANSDNSVGTTTDVGTYHPWRSYYGLYDASGNVWEWCQDWYGVTYPSGVSDPAGPSTGSSKALRGGSWNLPAESRCRVETRSDSYALPSHVSYGYGFRCARTLE